MLPCPAPVDGYGARNWLEKFLISRHFTLFFSVQYKKQKIR